MSQQFVQGRSKGLTNASFSYCPGCTHGIIHKLVAESLEELGMLGNAIGMASVGCSVMSYNFFDCDMQQTAHGRACAVATGIKRCLPDRIVFSYQGDGDFAAIGIGEGIHAAQRAENITVFFVNNAIYGMTGGQMAPTTLIGQKTTTSPQGRNAARQGLPMKECEMFATNEGAAYVERVSLHDPRAVMNAKRAIKKALTYQRDGRGFTLVEFLSTCPINWGMTPLDALQWTKTTMAQHYPLGVFADRGGTSNE